jgi:predicted phosphodiesterase
MRRKLELFAILVAVAVSALSPFAVYGQTSDSSAGDDGPYVLWRDDSTATVIDLCRNEVRTQDVTATDTLGFKRICGYSAVAYSIPVAPPQVEPWVYDGVSKILAVSDIHGEYEALTELLKNSGVIDRKLRWQWGDGHLVVNGDVFDRGDRVTECLWLIYKLELQARRRGGRVHFVLGNHDIMVMQGDNRYVHKKYLDGVARKLKVIHEDLYGPDMELGRWLRTKHVAVRLNDILFVHGGVSPELLEHGYSMEQVNQLVRDHIDTRSYFLKFDDQLKLLFGNFGPLWFRGQVTDHGYAMVTEEQLDEILKHFRAAFMVVGHSEIDRIVGYYHQRVYPIDTPVKETGHMEGLLWEGGTFYRVKGSSGEREIIGYNTGSQNSR